MAEAEYCEDLLKRLENEPSIRSLVSAIRSYASLSDVPSALLFELRVAGHLHSRVTEPVYEYPTGVGDSSVDFRFVTEREWYVEAVSIEMSDAVRKATWTRGLAFGASLSTANSDPRQSEAGELLLAQQKIGEKVWTNGANTKFPEPAANRLHLVLADMRGFGLTAGDVWDYAEIAYGHRGIPDDLAPYRHWWPREEGKMQRIFGLFEPENRFQRAAEHVQRRIHFLGFSFDGEYVDGSIAENSHYLANPHLLADEQAAADAFRTLPLRPTSSDGDA